ncbi:MAG: hypothetical protein DRO40_13555 [Thermoprotei archaeon]|nr:MAG: hypothetical protein DRO40_13555 [Thermoprotei archaeon]
MDKLFLDTTYILPILGVKVELKDYTKYFPQVYSFYETYYSPVSLIEAKWIIIKIIKNLKNIEYRQKLLYEYRSGLNLLINDNKLRQSTLTNSLIEELADQLWEFGIKDYFDRMIYATASYYRAILVTEDKQLHRIYEESFKLKFRPKDVINWDELRTRLEEKL